MDNENISVDTEEMAREMLDLFEQHTEENSEGVSLLTIEGLAELSVYFGYSVEEEFRAEVFLIFLNLLNEAGYQYDMSQFMSIEEEDDEDFTS